MPDVFRPVQELLENCMGDQAQKIADIPSEIDQFVGLIETEHGGTKENPRVINKVITFELPEDWGDRVSGELRRIEKNLHSEGSKGSFWPTFFGVVIVIWILYAIFV